MIYINNPHNPTGLLMPLAIFDGVVELCRKHGILLFCDEVFRGLEHNGDKCLPAACDAYENAVSLGSMSKTYGLPGLRLGWLVSRNASILQSCLDFRLYTTISNSSPSEFLTHIALRHHEALIQRNIGIVRRNLALLEQFFEEHCDLFEWVKPEASPMCFVHFKPNIAVSEFCDDLVRESGVMLLPGTVYDEPRHIRFGYGRKNMPQALDKLNSYLVSEF